MNATALELKWTGQPLFPTEVKYQSFFNETGALMAQHTSLVPISVKSFEINVDDSVPGYLHTFSLKITESLVDMENPITTTSFTFGKSLPLGEPLNLHNTNYDLYTADKKYFQIQFGPVDYCLNWEVSYCSYMKTKSLRACIAFTQDSNNILSISSLTKVLLNVEIGVSLIPQ